MTVEKSNYINPNRELSLGDLFTKLLVFRSMALPHPEHSASQLFFKLAEMADKGNNRAIKKIFERLSKGTAVKLFFGGVGLKETEQNAKKLIDKKTWVIVDYSAPEGTEKLDDTKISEVKQEYKNAIDACKRLNEYAGNNHAASLAIKVTTIAEFNDLKNISSILKYGGSFLDSKEGRLFNRIKKDLFEVLEHGKGIRIFIDAEETAINPAIKQLAKEALLAGYKIDVTIQAYLKDCVDNATDWMNFSKQKINIYGKDVSIGSRLGIKLVRGAYIKAKTEDRSQIWDQKSETDHAYDITLGKLYLSGQFGGITVATHNAASALRAAKLFEEHGETIQTQLEASTLLGMHADGADTSKIDNSKYFVYVAEDKLLAGIPYLGRRGTEHATTRMDDGERKVYKETGLILNEMGRRLGYSIAEKISGILSIGRNAKS